MKIGIDISQTAYANTGVSNYLESLVNNLLENDNKNEYILFFSSLRRKVSLSKFKISNARVKFMTFKYPPMLLDLVWNKLHILPIESLIGDVDLFITSDWTEPPTRKAKKVTILYDLIIYNFPEEMDEKIIATQKRKLKWVKKESVKVLCISEATKNDAIKILNIDENKVEVLYPGMTL